MELSPRLRMAARYLASGACRTQKEASEAAGLHPNYLTMVKASGNEKLAAYLAELDSRIEDSTIDMSKILQGLGRRAVRNIANLMETADKEEIRFRAAVDLADRSNETQKTHKHQVEAISITSGDITALTVAMLESARERQRYLSSGIATDGYDKGDTVESINHLIPRADEAPRDG